MSPHSLHPDKNKVTIVRKCHEDRKVYRTLKYAGGGQRGGMSTFAFGCFWFAEKGDSATKGGEVMPGERVKKRKGERVGVGREGKERGLQ